MNYESNLKKYAVLFVALFLLSLCACTSGGGQDETPITPSASSTNNETQSTQPDAPQTSPDETPTTVSGKLTVTFDYEKQSGHGSNQFAAWIEDADGKLIKTLYATKFTAGGGYKNRPDSIPVWVEKSGLASLQKSDVDAITGATPKAGNLSYDWDCKDADGNPVFPGQYAFMLEGTLRGKNQVLYTGEIEIGDSPETADATAEYTYEAADNYPALTADSPENSMIDGVTAHFTPAAGN